MPQRIILPFTDKFNLLTFYLRFPQLYSKGDLFAVFSWYVSVFSAFFVMGLMWTLGSHLKYDLLMSKPVQFGGVKNYYNICWCDNWNNKISSEHSFTEGSSSKGREAEKKTHNKHTNKKISENVRKHNPEKRTINYVPLALHIHTPIGKNISCEIRWLKHKEYQTAMKQTH